MATMQNQLASLDEPQSAKQLSGNTTRDKTQIGIIVIIAMREKKMPHASTVSLNNRIANIQKSVEFNSIFFSLQNDFVELWLLTADIGK